MNELRQIDVASSMYLFDSEGLMTKTIKSSLVKELQKFLDRDGHPLPVSCPARARRYGGAGTEALSAHSARCIRPHHVPD